MSRKRYTPKTEITPALLKFREKRKWQISLRRYVIEKQPCVFYAPYFGLDINNMRQWFDYQFKDGATWGNFGSVWQFDHIIPVTFFDFSKEDELKICWNFTNIRVEHFQRNKDRGNRLDVLAAKNFFNELYSKTNYLPCRKLLEKIDEIEFSEFISTDAQQSFIKNHWDYLNMIDNYYAFEFELLNNGRSVEDVRKEIQLLKEAR